MSAPLVVVSHNLMEGLQLQALCAHHRRVRDEVGLDILCLQENRRAPDGVHAEVVESSLGETYTHICEDPECGVSVVYDTGRVELIGWELFLLPAAERISWFERAVILDGRPAQTRALLAVFERDGERFALVNFHLDTVGGTAHRAAQTHSIADLLVARRLADRVVVAGDTNAFAFRDQPAALARVLAPFADIGAVDPSTAPTHFFARQNEPKLAHRTVVALGKLGLDLPMRYDVLCTNMEVADRGHVTTPESDHDLVWVALS